MAVVAGALNEAAHLLEHVQAVVPVDLFSKDGDGPRRGADQPQDHFQGGGLARPVGAEKSVDSPLRDLQIQVIYPQDLAVLLAQAPGLHDVCHRENTSL